MSVSDTDYNKTPQRRANKLGHLSIPFLRQLLVSTPATDRYPKS
ncbi:MAG TPA: hypothetical protein VGN90_06440 [Pyrinomonadaceae bacterium]|jgi:hypothetical protein|nr:hypothetical protein [Pyrinomonadaceae bacterium]